MTPVVVSSYLFVTVAVLYALAFKMVPALFSGMLAYLVITMLANRISAKVSNKHSKMIALSMILLIVGSITVGVVFGGIYFLKDAGAEFKSLLEKMASIISQMNSFFPPSVTEHFPKSAEDIKHVIADWLKSNSHQLGSVGKGALSMFAHVLIAAVIGAMLAFHQFVDQRHDKKLTKEIKERLSLFSTSFSNVVFAQVKISAINTTFTAIYLLVVLPLAGHPLPYTKTMIAITFVAGLLPVIGNLISNVVIVVVSAEASPAVAVWSLVFLVVIHKLEYFINAKIVGSRINASAWELLFAMLVMESVFGVQGIVLAPILYAYIKAELAGRNLI